MIPLLVAFLQVAPVDGVGRLAPFYEALARVEAGGDEVVRVTHLGDSHVAADMWTGHVRRGLQARFGDGGRGFVLAGRGWRSYTQAGVRHDSPGGWRVDGLRGGVDDGLWTPGGCSLASADPTSSTRVETERPFRAVEVFFLRQPAGGCFEVRAQGHALARVSSRGPWLVPGFRQFDVPEGTQHVEMQPLGGGESRLLGVSLTNGHGGVVYDALGTNGAQARHLLRHGDELVTSLLSRLDPTLLVISYGANELYDDHLGRDRYAADLAHVLTRLRRAYDGACLLTGPPDMMHARRPPALGPELRSVQRALAAAHGCAFWDAQTAMGGPGSIRRWRREGRAGADFVHLTRDGYAVLGEALLAALLDGYAASAAMDSQDMSAH